MNKEEGSLDMKIEYVKPEILDLGPASIAYGAACNPSGSSADSECSNGTSAQGYPCTDGQFAGTGACGDGGAPLY
ncbi:MAG: hypothetical protein JXR84_27405 [Anaerolineae bacterium]|nr:hypothetical protein [Anaerolineae bacterium]